MQSSWTVNLLSKIIKLIGNAILSRILEWESEPRPKIEQNVSHLVFYAEHRHTYPVPCTNAMR